MFCRLCFNDAVVDSQDLYNADGLVSDVHNTVIKYFELNYATDKDEVKSSRIICSSCWQHIDDFDKFKQTVLDAQQRYNNNFTAVLTSDILLKEEQYQFLNEVGVAAEASAAVDDDDSNDDLPLQVRWQKLMRAKCKIEQNEAETDLSPLVEIELNAADTADDWTQGLSSADEGVEQDPVDVEPVQLAASKPCATTKTRKRVGRPCKIARKVKKRNVPVVKAKQTDEHKDKDKDSPKLDYDGFIAEHWKSGLPCDLCDFSAQNYTGLHAHFRKAHTGTRGYVVCCDRKHHRRHQLVEHIKIHLNPETFQCPQCKKCSHTKRGLQTHIKRIHAENALERKYACEVCQKRFAKPAILRGHMLLHAAVSKDHECPECGKCFVVESKLQVHMRTVHNPENVSVCEQCGKFFKDRYSFKAHMLQHEGVAPRKWHCDQCDAALNTKFSLKRHMRVVHQDRSVAYICSVCGKVALTAEALRSHKRNVHERERKHVCNICGKGFKVKLVLTEHMTIHTGQNLYNCPHCPKTFRVSANMHHHRKRVHPKEWAATRQHRVLVSSLDLSSFDKEVVI